MSPQRSLSIFIALTHVHSTEPFELKGLIIIIVNKGCSKGCIGLWRGCGTSRATSRAASC